MSMVPNPVLVKTPPQTVSGEELINRYPKSVYQSPSSVLYGYYCPDLFGTLFPKFKTYSLKFLSKGHSDSIYFLYTLEVFFHVPFDSLRKRTERSEPT